MTKMGRARIIRELDDQYTLMVFKKNAEESRERLQSTVPNLTLAAAFNNARDALAAFVTGSEKHEEITITTRIEAD